ncbi:SDR family oxidoreductase [Actinosynnema sp. NPDC047251]|uniref:Nucleotide-diphosphate-sugar epimerase/NmrA family protein n=1 Tax=Saccharothrix espanaensis (strain ATCC 51144 / DSM 44229 / JCM 9112 / NBRC 15066 / NRRL 15764) TaxID=1179773 RepID=K0K2I3_SACES|nr:SDR family oxidoreductase [Saccharothrix espanaensis]CCH31792.1 Nucleotide-diphosphate-sugar epimerase/NmrA family protein [Saccharothrix espanaensis DSM 44229]
MKVVVIGGTGLIGSTVVTRLGEHGHEAVAAAPSTGVDTITGEGLAAVLAGADVLVDVSNSPSFADADVLEFFRTATTNLVAAARGAGVGHYVALSVVGAERAPESGYLRAKVVQEGLIRESGLRHSLVHATQFFEFAGGIADSATADGVVTLPDGGVQPVAAADVAGAVARTAVGTPLDGSVEIGGPEVFGMDGWIRTVLTARHDPRTVVTDPAARYFGTPLEAGTLLPGPGALIGETRLADWLTRTTRRDRRVP